MGTWYIDSNLNQGYPTWTDFISAPTGWTDTGNVPLNKLAWRIRSGINEGYPFLGYWFDSSSGQQGGEMELGGNQTNYPNGFTNANRGTLYNSMNERNMDSGGTTQYITYTNTMLANALAGMAFALTENELYNLSQKFRDPSFINDSTKMGMVEKVYGANIYDSVLMCKAYPFEIGNSQMTEFVWAYGIYQLSDISKHRCTNFLRRFNMGGISLEISQAWEIENVDYSLYLPYAGTFPIDVRNAEEMTLELDVDLLTGAGEYTLRQNGQITNCWKCVMGYDIPICSYRGQAAQNGFGFVTNMIGQGAKLAATALGGPVAGAVVGGVADVASNMFESHNTVSAPKMGGLSGSASYPRPRLIAKIPKMFKDGEGYPEIIGENRSCKYTQLRSCSGFTQCQNYKCDVIVATTEEKQEIESLMNAGVFL